MKKQVVKLLERQAEMSRQLMVFGAVLFVTGIMSVGIMQMTEAATTGTTNMNLIVTAGSLGIDAVPTTLTLATNSPGQIANVNTGGSNPLQTNDARGGDTGYTVSTYFNSNLLNGSNELPMTGMNLYASAITIENNSANNAQTELGSDGFYGGTGSSNGKTLFNGGGGAGTNGAGTFNVHNIKFNFSIPGGAATATYETLLIITIV